MASDIFIIFSNITITTDTHHIHSILSDEHLPNKNNIALYYKSSTCLRLAHFQQSSRLAPTRLYTSYIISLISSMMYIRQIDNCMQACLSTRLIVNTKMQPAQADCILLTYKILNMRDRNIPSSLQVFHSEHILLLNSPAQMAYNV